jgi:hypothetical protein
VLNATVAVEPVDGEIILVIEGASGIGLTKTKADRGDGVLTPFLIAVIVNLYDVLFDKPVMLNDVAPVMPDV